MPTTLINNTSTIASARPKPTQQVGGVGPRAPDGIETRRVGVTIAQEVVVGRDHRVDGDVGEQVRDAPGEQRERSDWSRRHWRPAQ